MQPAATKPISEDQLEKMGDEVNARASSTSSTGDHDNDAFNQVAHHAFSEEDGKRVLRKIDTRIMPLLVGCYILSFLDKTLLNYSSIFGLQKALHLHGTQYSWTSSIFSFGYLVGQPIAGRLIQRYSLHVGKIITLSVFIWSCMVLLTPVCKDFKSLAVLRFFLGVFESPVAPAIVHVTSTWYTRDEQSFRTGLWFCGTPIGNIIGGVLSYAIGSIKSTKHVQQWQIFYLFFGAISFLYSFVLAAFLPDTQLKARFLTQEQKEIAVERVRANHTVSADKHFKWDQAIEFILDPQAILIFLIAFVSTLPSVAASSFSSLIVKGLGDFTALQTTVISSIPASTIQIMTLAGLTYIATKYPGWRLWLSIISSVPPLVGAVLLHNLPTHNVGGRLTGYYLTFTHSGSYIFALSLLASNFGGSTKKIMASAAVFIGYSAALIAGPQFFLSSQAPNYTEGFAMMISTYSIMIPLCFILRVYYVWENGRRDKLVAAERDGEAKAHAEEDEGFTDLTDRQQWRTFRYTM
ncbi:MFS general substrate transporter [Meredithblackwellia eburnea MCA 4105]